MDTEYLKKVGIFVVSVVLSIGILFYFGYHIWHSFTREIETVAATQVTHMETIEAEGYIFRTETCSRAFILNPIQKNNSRNCNHRKP